MAIPDRLEHVREIRHEVPNWQLDETLQAQIDEFVPEFDEHPARAWLFTKKHEKEIVRQADAIFSEIQEHVRMRLEELHLEDKMQMIETELIILWQELFYNAFWHGNGLNPNKMITIAFEVRDTVLHVLTKDEGSGFDVLQHRIDEKDPEREWRPGGNGLTMLELYSSSIEWNKKGNVVYLTRDITRKELTEKVSRELLLEQLAKRKQNETHIKA